LKLRRRWGNIEEIIAATITRAEKTTSKHQMEIEIEKDLPAVRVDARAVSEVLFTLVDNAAKYSQAGTPIQIEACRADNDMIEMSVKDRGRGIPPQLRVLVFDKFFRASGEGGLPKSHPSGTGMGLAIARGIVEAHGGRIWIDEPAGERGTRVTFTLPIGDEEEPPRYGGSSTDGIVEATAETMALKRPKQKS
jgi:two-component system sensor histidine kinase KdpD